MTKKHQKRISVARATGMERLANEKRAATLRRDRGRLSYAFPMRLCAASTDPRPRRSEVKAHPPRSR